MITLNGSAPNGKVQSNLTFDGLTLVVSTSSTTKPLIIASASSSDDLVRITQTGTGNSFVVEDSSNPDSTPFVIDNNGNVGVGISPNSSYKIYAYSGVNTGIRGDGQVQGVYGLGVNDNGVIGVQGVATDNGSPFVSSVFIGGKYTASGGAGYNYSLQLLDGTEGLDKVLVSQTSDGKSNWSNTLKGLVSVSASNITSTTINSGNNTIQTDMLIQAGLLFLANNC